MGCPQAQPGPSSGPTVPTKESLITACIILLTTVGFLMLPCETVSTQRSYSEARREKL